MTQKTYKKILVSGNIIEIYEFEKDPYINCDDRVLEANDGYDPFDLENTKLELKESRKDERRKQTLRDARNLARRLALNNFSNESYFITLTCKPELKTDNIKKFDAMFKKFVLRFNRRYKCNMKYLMVREFHEDGSLHAHMLCDFRFKMYSDKELRKKAKEEGLTTRQLNNLREKEKEKKLLVSKSRMKVREAERFFGEQLWENGFVDIQGLRDCDNVGAYIIKYMTKDISIHYFRNQKIYLCSSGLDRPQIYRDYEADAIIKAYGLETKQKVFTNSYESEYLGQIVYSEYNLIRQ